MVGRIQSFNSLPAAEQRSCPSCQVCAHKFEPAEKVAQLFHSYLTCVPCGTVSRNPSTDSLLQTLHQWLDVSKRILDSVGAQTEEKFLVNDRFPNLLQPRQMPQAVDFLVSEENMTHPKAASVVKKVVHYQLQQRHADFLADQVEKDYRVLFPSTSWATHAAAALVFAMAAIGFAYGR